MQASAPFSKAPDRFSRKEAQENERAALEALVTYVAELGASGEGAVKSQADALRLSLRDVLNPKFT